MVADPSWKVSLKTSGIWPVGVRYDQASTEGLVVKGPGSECRTLKDGSHCSGSSLMETGQHCSKRDEPEQKQRIFSAPWQHFQVCRVAQKQHRRQFVKPVLGKSDLPVWNVTDKMFSQISVGTGIALFLNYLLQPGDQRTWWNHVTQNEKKRNAVNRHKCYLNTNCSSFSLKDQVSVSKPTGSRLTYNPYWTTKSEILMHNMGL